MTLVIIAGGIDLSVGPTAAVAAVFTATFMFDGMPVIPAVLIGLGIGVLGGLINGLLISRAKLQPETS